MSTNLDSILTNLHVEITGPEAGPRVVLLHGWGSSAQLMHPVAEMLADTYRIYNLDLPGHGRTPPPPEAWGVPEYAALVARFMELQVRTPTTLIGHSNGGRIGLYLASESGMDHLIQQLVLVSPSGIRPVRPWTFYLKKYTAKSLKAPFMILPEPIRSHCLDWLRHTLLWKALGSSDYRSLQGVMRETFVKTVNYYVEDRLDRINVPTLLFWGDQDTAVSRREMEMLEKHIPDAGLVVLKGAGHYGYLDDPVTFRAAVRHFLGGI